MVNAASDALRDELQQLIREREQEGVRGLAERVGPADWADLIPQLDPNEVAVLLQWLPDEEIPEIFEELDPSIAASILRTLSANEAAVVLGGMDPDDAADVVENLPDADVDEILVRMRAEDATQIRTLANYEPDTAGGLMTPEYVAVSREARASEAIAAIRRLVDQAETVSYVYVVDAERHLLGVLSLYRLMLSGADTPVVELMAPPKEISIRVAPGMPPVRAEKIPLQQVFMNLIGNAVKHTGKVDPVIDISWAEDGEFYEFAVADNGQGIAPQYHERIFGIFQTLEARDKVEGTGIGLSVVQKIVDAKGGRVWVESQPGQGATFKFLWPKTDRAGV